MFITPKKDRLKDTNSIGDILDREWLKSTFIINDSDIVGSSDYLDFIKKNRYFSTADIKYTSTAPGMNMSVNPKPQFTRYCDIRSPGIIKDRPDVTLGTGGHSTGLGLGHYYSEAIDDNQTRIFLRFGVPSYTSLLMWLSRSFDIDRTVLQNRGTITSTFIEAVGLLAKMFAVSAAPFLGLGMYTLKVMTSTSRFYGLKDTMYIYWSTVETILNKMIARRTMVPFVFQDFSFKIENIANRPQTVNSDFVNSLNEIIPDVIDASTGRISVFALALRAQAQANRAMVENYNKHKEDSLATGFSSFQNNETGRLDDYFVSHTSKTNVSKWLLEKAYNLIIKDNKSQEIDTTSEEGNTISSTILLDELSLDSEGNPISLDIDPSDPNDSIDKRIQDNAKAKSDTFSRYGEYLLAEFSEGGAFAIFSVDNPGSVGETFSNSTTSNPVESTFNAISSKSRNMTNMLSAAADIPIIKDVLSLAADTGATILSNATFGIANPLLALAYGVNVTMPKVWESSSASLPRASYKMKLISPYGNAYSQLFNIYLPLAMILAGSLPRTTGMSTYTSPFLCEMFDRGRNNIKLGMIDSVSITRGTSNLAFSRGGHPSAIDVDFSIANLDEIISVDVSSNGIITKFMKTIDPDFSDTPLESYLNILTGVDVYSQIYRLPMIRLKLAERMMIVKSITNPDPAAFAAFSAENIPFTNLIREAFSNNHAALQNLMHN